MGPVFVRLTDVGPSAAGFYRVAIGGVGLAALPAAGGTHPTTRPGIPLMLLAGFAFAVDLAAWHRSIHAVGPGLATLLANFQVFVLALAGVVWFGERFTARLALAIGGAVVGLALLVGVDRAVLSSADRAGILFGLLAALSYGTFLLVLRRTQMVRGARPVVTLTVVCAVATALLLPAGLAEPGGLRLPDATNVALLVAYALTTQIVAWVLIAGALPLVPAGRAGLLLLLQPALAFLWDVLLFGRPAEAGHPAGAAVTLGAIYLGMTARAPGSASRS